MPVDRLVAGMKAAAAQLAATPEAGLAAEKAVMTTDTKPKQAAVQVKIGGRTVTVGGMCKGSGMIEPNMATMLGFITTDAAITPAMLRRALRQAIAVSFNHVVVDGDESTNDSVFLLASGAAGNATIAKAGPDYDAFLEALTAVGISLARQMAADGEGATKYVEVTVRHAKTQRDADRAARAVAKSPLAKTRIPTGAACSRPWATPARRWTTAPPRCSTGRPGRTGRGRWRTLPSSRSSPARWMVRS